MNVTITHTIAPEVISILEKLLSNNAGGTQSTAPAKEIAAVKKLPVKKNEPAPEEKEAVPETGTPLVSEVAKTPDSTEPVTIEAIRLVVTEKAQNGKKDAVKALLTEYGTASVTNLGKLVYDEFFTKVKAL